MYHLLTVISWTKWRHSALSTGCNNFVSYPSLSFNLPPKPSISRIYWSTVYIHLLSHILLSFLFLYPLPFYSFLSFFFLSLNRPYTLTFPKTAKCRDIRSFSVTPFHLLNKPIAWYENLPKHFAYKEHPTCHTSNFLHLTTTTTTTTTTKTTKTTTTDNPPYF